MVKRNRRNIIIISAASLLLLTAGFLIMYPVPSPPVIKMKTARDSLSVALKNHADKYFPQLYRQAEISYDSAMAIWKRENERFIYVRNFDRVEDYARLSAKMSNLACCSTYVFKPELTIKLAGDIDSLKKLVRKINEDYSSFPFPFEIRERISRGKMLLKDAETAYAGELLPESDSLIKEAHKMLLSGPEFADINLREYFKSFPLWEKWINTTINASKTNGTYSIIVDKFARKLFLYHKGKKTAEYSVELGQNWVGNKRLTGDKATPEGMYKITKKLEGKNTKYHKALLLNYPNKEDSERFRREVSGGSLPASADIGGMIEIHGGGGKGVDWTDGCIALKNNEMDRIFRYTKIGTPVTIVGSMNDIDQVLKK